MENSGQNMYGDFEANNGGTFGLANQRNLQSQPHVMRAQNRGSSNAAAQSAGFASPYASVPNQSVQYPQQQFHQAGSSSGGTRLPQIYLTNQYPLGQPETLIPPIIPDTNHAKKRVVDASLDRAKKRKTDQEYRLRCKEKEIENKKNLDALVLDNKRLKNQNESLKKQNLEMGQTLQSHEEELKQLKNGFDQLKRECDLDETLVQALSELVALPNPSNIQLENNLKDIIAALSQTPNQEDLRLQLREENKKLKEEKMRLKVKEQALCEKIINDED